MSETTNKQIGTFQWHFEGKMNFADLYALNEFDRDYFRPVGLNENEMLFRYGNEKTKLSNILPLIKINVITGRIYFLSERGSEMDMAHFETRGIRSSYLVVDIDLELS